ncbi:MAG: patatin [Gammaproteobacteria bacterium]|nr:patatin [Gammaproteobacteria bacterium]
MNMCRFCAYINKARLWCIPLVPILLLANGLVFAADQELSRPKIGLALSGGGARGAAHVGVLKVIEELQIPVDYIAGTSMGAVIGGLYASGMSSEEIEHQFNTINWTTVFNDKPERPERSQRRKSDDRLYLIEAKIGINDAGLHIPKSAIEGQKFNFILKSLTLPVADITNFDDLPIPFRAVAMDIASGDEVILGKGDLATAIQASMAIPAVFSPINLNDKILVDGGGANNLPISVVRSMGADIVIAVDISTPLLEQDELNDPLAVIVQLTGLLTRRNVERQLQTLNENDVLIIPALESVDSMNFDRVVEAIKQGEQAATKQVRLSALSLNSKEYKDHKKTQKGGVWQQPVVHFLHIENDSELSNEVIQRHLAIEVGQPLNIKAMETAISTVYGLDIFESVRYDLVTEDGKTGVKVSAKEKSWGTDSLQSGLELANDSNGDSSYNIAFAYTKQPLNSLNGEWRSVLQAGERPGFLTEVYQPLDPASRYFIHTGLSWLKSDIRIFEGNGSGRADAEYDVEHRSLTFNIGRNIGNWGELRFGVRRLAGEALLDVGGASFEDFDFDDGYFLAKAQMDTIDNPGFPRSGYHNSIEWNSAKESLGADKEYEQLNVGLFGVKSRGNNAVMAGLNYGSTLSGEVAISNRFELGGFLNLSGYKVGELSGQHYGLLSLAFQRRIYQSKFAPTYAGAAFQLGNTWENKDDIKFADMISSATLFAGVDTALGPLYLGYGDAEGRSNGTVYLFLGHPF